MSGTEATVDPKTAPGTTPAADDGKTEQDYWNDFKADEEKDLSAEKIVSEQRGEAAGTGEESFQEAEAAAAPAEAEDGKKAPAAAKPSPAQSEQAPAIDPLENASPEIRAAFEAERAERRKLEERIRRDDGRVSAYQRRYEELAREKAAGKKQAPPSIADTVAAELSTDFPEVAEPLKKSLGAVDAQLAEFRTDKQKQQDAFDAQMKRDIEDNKARIAAAHGKDWGKFISDNADAFVAWTEDQPKAIREKVYVNRRAMVDPDAAIEVIGLFKTFQAGGSAAPATATPPATAPAASSQQQLDARRRAQLAGATAPSTPAGRPKPSGIPENADEQTLWNMWKEADPDEAQFRRRA